MFEDRHLEAKAKAKAKARRVRGIGPAPAFKIKACANVYEEWLKTFWPANKN